MSDTDVDTEVIANRWICKNCIGDPCLKLEISQGGDKKRCNYCNSLEKGIEIGDLAERVDNIVQEHFQLTPDQPDGLEYTLLKYSEYEWERHGEATEDVICDIVAIDNQPARDIRIILEWNYKDFKAEAAGEENPFSEEAHYEGKEVDDYELVETWGHFRKIIKKETRHFNRDAEKILSEIFEGLDGHVTTDSTPVIVKIGPKTDVPYLHRARVFQSSESLKKAMIAPDVELGPPPFLAAMPGRMNARGISLFYGATSEGVALSEVRPPVGSRVAVARFEILQELRLLDVEALGEVYVDGSFFEADYTYRLARAKFLKRLSDEITTPVMPIDESSDYLVTQAIADYLANMENPTLDGVIYRSVQNGSDGVNVVLFHKKSRVETLEIPNGVRLRASLKHWNEEDGPVNYYSVMGEKVEVPEDKKIDEQYIFNDPDGFGFKQADYRNVTLRIDADNIKVHHIESIRVDATSYPVRRILNPEAFQF